MLSRRQLLSGVAALLLAPPDLLEPRKKVWALGALASSSTFITGRESAAIHVPRS